MQDNMKIINMEEHVKNIETQIHDILKNVTYPELSKYIAMLPNEHDGEEQLYYWGISYLNEYYKIICMLEEDNSPEIAKLKHRIYILYLAETFYYEKTVFSFDEFITFSRILNVAFSDYNPNKIREFEKEPYQSGDDAIDYIVNKIVSNVRHKPNPHAYEVTKFRLKILLNILDNKRTSLLDRELEEIDLDNTLIISTLSEGRIRDLKKTLERRQSSDKTESR